jgi:hypothetical protein
MTVIVEGARILRQEAGSEVIKSDIGQLLCLLIENVKQLGKLFNWGSGIRLRI